MTLNIVTMVEVISLKLSIKNLSQLDFAPFGDVLEFSLAEAGFQVK